MGIIDKAKTALKGFLGNSDSAEEQLGPEYNPQTGNPNKDEELLAFVRDTYSKDFRHIKDLSEIWKQNRLSYEGNSQDMMGGDASDFMEFMNKNLVYSSTITADKIDSLTAIQVQGKPTLLPLPHISEEGAQKLAQFIEIDPATGQPEISPHDYGRKLWEECVADLLERRNIQTLITKLAKDGRLCGAAILKICQRYDYDKQKFDIYLDIIQAENFAVDCSALELKNAKRMHYRTYLSAYELEQRYPKFKEEIRAAAQRNSSGEKEYQYETDDLESGGMDYSHPKYDGLVCIAESYYRDMTVEKIMVAEAEKDPDTDEVIAEAIYEERPKYPTGRRITHLPKLGIILKDEPNPYRYLPFAMFVPSPTSFSLYGRIEATPLATLQTMADKTMQQMHANMKAVGNVKMLYLKNSISDPDAIDNSIETIEVTQPGAINYVKAVNILNDGLAMLQTIRGEADNISGVNAPTEGRAVPSLTSGKAIGLLQEQDNRKVRVSQDAFAEFFREVGRQIAALMLELYHEGDMLTVSDEDGIPIRLPISLADFTDGIEMRVSNDSQIPIDPMGRLTFYEHMANLPTRTGVPTIDGTDIMKMLNFPGFAEIKKRNAAMATAQTMQGAQGRIAPQPNAGTGQPNILPMEAVGQPQG